MDDIMGATGFTPFTSYNESADFLMKALGFTPTEKVGPIVNQARN
jgi:hypothetical protein